MTEAPWSSSNGRDIDSGRANLSIQPNQSERREPSQARWSLSDIALFCLFLIAWLMAIFAMRELVPEQGPEARLKALIAATGAAGAGYVINTVAIRTGSYYAAIGYWSAGIGSVLAILFVGAALWASTFSGLILPSVAELQLIERGQQQALAIASRVERTRRGDQNDAALSFVVADLRELARCEAESSCTSLKTSGGRGIVARTLATLVPRGDAIIAAKKSANDKMSSAIEALNTSSKDYQRIIGSADGSVWSRRSEAIIADAKLMQQMSEIDMASASSAVAVFVSELDAGVSLPQLPDVAERLNDRLRGHAARLREQQVTASAQPDLGPFPARPGVATAIGYLPHFAPLALFVAAIELIIPILLWTLRTIAIHWEIEKRLGRRSKPDNDDDPTSGGTLRSATRHLAQPERPQLAGRTLLR